MVPNLLGPQGQWRSTGAGRGERPFEVARVEYRGDRTRFTGYEKLAAEGRVTALYVDGASVTEIASGQDAIVVLDTTPFYAESGGQVGDSGELVAQRRA